MNNNTFTIQIVSAHMQCVPSFGRAKGRGWLFVVCPNCAAYSYLATVSSSLSLPASHRDRRTKSVDDVKSDSFPISNDVNGTRQSCLSSSDLISYGNQVPALSYKLLEMSILLFFKTPPRKPSKTIFNK